MTDQSLRAAERRFREIRSPESYQALVAAWLRAGRRDPRRVPRPGDEVDDRRVVEVLEDREHPRRGSVRVRGRLLLGPAVRWVDVTRRERALRSVDVKHWMTMTGWSSWAKKGEVRRIGLEPKDRDPRRDPRPGDLLGEPDEGMEVEVLGLEGGMVRALVPEGREVMFTLDQWYGFRGCPLYFITAE